MFIELIECLLYSQLRMRAASGLLVPLKCFMKDGRQRERVIRQSHKLIRGRTKVRHTLAAFSASGKNASLGIAKWGLA